MMIIFNFIFSIIIILIIYFLISSILKYLLKIFNKYEYKNYCLFLPTFLAMGTWSLGFLMWYFTLTYLMNIDIIKIITGSITLGIALYFLNLNMWVALPVGIIIYFATVYLLRVFDDDDKYVIKEILGKN